MRALIVCITLICFLVVQTDAVAQPHQDGVDAGRAANSTIQPDINTSNASAVVPNYTTTPPETIYYGQPSLNSPANARLTYCATHTDDPTCDAQQNAATSAALPKPNLTADTDVAEAHTISQDLASHLGDLSEYYAGCVPSGSPGTPCPTNVFCFAGNCYDTTYTNDADFARTQSYLEAAREAGVYLDPNTMTVFNGEPDRCRLRLLKNCCYSSGSGAGMSNQSLFGSGSKLVFDALMDSGNRQFLYQGMSAMLTGAGFSGAFTTYGVTVAVNGAAIPAGSVVVASSSGGTVIVAVDPWTLVIMIIIMIIMSMMSCSDGEGMLAMKEGAGLCHTVGTRCTSCRRVLGRCVSCIGQTRTKCCFNSRLSRMINEQGRGQIGKGWGSARDPDCSGFTVAQLQSLNFAAMDLTEFYAEIAPTLPNASALQNRNTDRATTCYTNQGRCP